MTSHPNPENICIIGAGDGGIVREVLKHNPKHVIHAELDEGVVNASKQYFPSIHANCWEDPRVRLEIGDGRQFLEDTEDKFDVVIMDMTDPFGPATMLYTQEFFNTVKSTFRDENSMFVMHAESTVTNPRTFQQITHTLGQVFPSLSFCHLYVQMYSTLWSIAIASNTPLVDKTPQDLLQTRLNDRGISGLQAYSPTSHYAMQAGFPFIDTLRETANELPLITDAHSEFLDEAEMDASLLNERLNP